MEPDRRQGTPDDSCRDTARRDGAVISSRRRSTEIGHTDAGCLLSLVGQHVPTFPRRVGNTASSGHDNGVAPPTWGPSGSPIGDGGPVPLDVALSSHTHTSAVRVLQARLSRGDKKRKLSFARQRAAARISATFGTGQQIGHPYPNATVHRAGAVSDGAGTPHGHLDPAAPLVMVWKPPPHPSREPEPFGSQQTNDPVPIW